MDAVFIPLVHGILCLFPCFLENIAKIWAGLSRFRGFQFFRVYRNDPYFYGCGAWAFLRYIGDRNGCGNSHVSWFPVPVCRFRRNTISNRRVPHLSLHFHTGGRSTFGTCSCAGHPGPRLFCTCGKRMFFRRHARRRLQWFFPNGCRLVFYILLYNHRCGFPLPPGHSRGTVGFSCAYGFVEHPSCRHHSSAIFRRRGFFPQPLHIPGMYFDFFFPPGHTIFIFLLTAKKII